MIQTFTQLRDRTIQVGDGVFDDGEFVREEVGDALVDAGIDLIA